MENVNTAATRKRPIPNADDKATGRNVKAPRTSGSGGYYYKTPLPSVGPYKGERAPHDPTFDFTKHRLPETAIHVWSRPPLDPALPEYLDLNKPFDFQLVSCKAEYVQGRSNSHCRWDGRGQVPVFRLYGVTSTGQSVCVNVWNFAPYLFINAPKDRPIMDEAEERQVADELQVAINKFLERDRFKKGNSSSAYSVDMNLDDEEKENYNGEYDDADHPDAELYFNKHVASEVLDVDDMMQQEETRQRNASYRSNRHQSRHEDDDALASMGSGWANMEDVARQGLMANDLVDLDMDVGEGTGLYEPGFAPASRGPPKPTNPLVIGVKAERYLIADHFQPEPLLVYKVGLRTPNLITKVREIIGDSEDAGFAFGKNLRIRGPTYESGVRFENRFMLDHNMVGTGWITVAGGKYTLRDDNNYESRCQIEVDVDTEDIVGHTPTSNPEIYTKVSGIRIHSYDIECVAKEGFPQSTRDPVTNIHAVVWAMDEPDKLIADVAFVLGSASPIGESTTMTACFENERDLLNAYGAFRIFSDADIYTGYNIRNFDERYLKERAKVVGALQFLQSTRSIKGVINGRIEVRQSKNLGNSERWIPENDGRVYIDMLDYAQNNMMQKLRSYTLNAVAYEILNDQKEDVDHKQIPGLFMGTQETRKRLGDYCRKDAILPRQLMIKLSALVGMFEQSRVQRVQLDQQQNGGASFKVFAQLLAKFRENGYIVPYRKNLEKIDYQGATVLEPDRGYYCDEPVGVEDFGSLYPSIAVAHNLCITTHVLNEDVAAVMRYFGFGEEHQAALDELAEWRRRTLDLGDDDEMAQHKAREEELKAQLKAVEDQVLYRCPAGHAYVLKKHREGVFPLMLSELLTLRQAAKKLVPLALNELERSVRIQREIALKVSANSGYGFHGLPSNGTFWFWIAESITARGREQIAISKRLIEAKFTKKNGYPADARVIYGDTDSVMILFGVKIKDVRNTEEVRAAVAEVMKYAEEAANYCTAAFEKPNTLNFENVYFPYLLLNKKRYAGQVWMKPRDPSKPPVPEKKLKIKGLESVRRDNCKHVAKTQEKCLDMIVREVNPEKAMKYAQQQIRNLLEGNVDLHDLVISGRLSKYFADYKTPQSHAYVRELIEKRTPGLGPKIGDRVPYVLVERDKKAKRYECAEDPVYVMNHNLPINTSYYLENQMFEPLLRIFGPIYTDAESQIKFGEHTRHIKKYISLETGGIASFFKERILPCKGCGVNLTQETTTCAKGHLCSQCEPSRASIYLEELAKLRQTQVAYSRIWTNCQSCQGSRFKPVICSAQDCPVFYKRTILKRDLEESTKLTNELGETPDPEKLAAHLAKLSLASRPKTLNPTSSPKKTVTSTFARSKKQTPRRKKQLAPPKPQEHQHHDLPDIEDIMTLQLVDDD